MSKVKNEEFRVVVFKEGDLYIAQCLEHDICAQASDVNALGRRMDAVIGAEREFAQANGKSLVEVLGPAPQHYHDMWDKAWGSRQDSGTMRLALCA